MRFPSFVSFVISLMVSLSGCARTPGVTFTLAADGRVLVEGQAVDDLRAVLKRSGSRVVYLRADDAVEQAEIWNLVSRLEAAGAEHVGLDHSRPASR